MADPQAPSIPVMFGDGPSADIRMIPMPDLQGALQQGQGRIASKMVGPKGDTIWVPQEDVQSAAQSGYQHYGAIQMRRPMNQGPPSIGQQISSGIQAVGNAIPGMIEGFGRSIGDPTGTALNSAVQAGIGVASQPTTGSKIAAGIAPAVGVDPLAVQQAAIHAGTTGDYGPLVATGVLPIAATHLATSKLGPQLEAPGYEPRPSTPVSDSVAAQRITDAVNPAPKQMAKFQANVEQQMPNIRQFVTEKPKTPSDLLNAVTKAQESKRADYYSNIIQPNADVNLPAPSLYKGAQAGNGNATIAQLDSRLSDINGMLTGAYDKEGAAQIQALSGPEKLALKAEAAQIRDVMNNELGTRTGLGAQAVAKARSDFGQLRDIQMKLQGAINRQRYYENNASNAQQVPHSATEAGARALKYVENKALGTPVERKIKSAF